MPDQDAGLLEGMTPEQMLAFRELMEKQSTLYIDGEEINPFLDLTAREIDSYRAVLRDTFGNEDPDEAPDHQVATAVLFVVRKRSNADYTVEEAMDVPQRQIRRPPEGKKNGRPTRAKAKA